MVLRKHRLVLVAIAAVLAVVGLTAFAWRSPAVRRQISLSVTRQPTPFTELSFMDHTNLPAFLSTSYTNEFAFTIGNHEGKAVSYPYVVTAKSSHGTTALATGTVNVDSGRSVRVPVSFLAPEPATQYVITVQLSGRPQLLHFAATS
jgi:hypothetical protein